MAKKIEIVGKALVVTDTVSGTIELTQPPVRTWYKEDDLQVGRISFYDLDGTEDISGTFDPINLADAVDGSLVAFTESTFRTFAQDNLGFNSPVTGALTNVVDVNSLSDFPTPVGGVIELVQTPGESRTYVLGAVNIDCGSNRFTITDGNIVIIGSHRTESTITSTTTGNLFTCVDAAFFPEKVGFDCINAKAVDFSTPVATFKSFVCDNVIIRNCTSIFSIEGAFTTSFRTLTIITSSVGGIDWTGTDSSQINMSNVLALSWVGTLFDLGTATFDIIDIGAGNRFVSPSGTTILSGASGSANLKANGRALVDNNLFNGTGNALGGGLDTMDLQWEYKGNIFVDGTTLNSRQLVDSFLTSPKTVTIGGGNQGVFFPVGGSNWSSDISDRFTVSTAGIIEYIGLKNIESEIMIFSTVEKDGGGSDKICGKVAIDTGSGFVVSDKTVGCTQNATPTGISSVGLFTLSTGDKIQLFVANEDGISDVIVSESTGIIKGG